MGKCHYGGILYRPSPTQALEIATKGQNITAKRCQPKRQRSFFTAHELCCSILCGVASHSHNTTHYPSVSVTTKTCPTQPTATLLGLTAAGIGPTQCCKQASCCLLYYRQPRRFLIPPNRSYRVLAASTTLSLHHSYSPPVVWHRRRRRRTIVFQCQTSKVFRGKTCLEQVVTWMPGPPPQPVTKLPCHHAKCCCCGGAAQMVTLITARLNFFPSNGGVGCDFCLTGTWKEYRKALHSFLLQIDMQINAIETTVRCCLQSRQIDRTSGEFA